jgi:hypothetical protein
MNVLDRIRRFLVGSGPEEPPIEKEREDAPISPTEARAHETDVFLGPRHDAEEERAAD